MIICYTTAGLLLCNVSPWTYTSNFASASPIEREKVGYRKKRWDPALVITTGTTSPASFPTCYASSPSTFAPSCPWSAFFHSLLPLLLAHLYQQESWWHMWESSGFSAIVPAEHYSVCNWKHFIVLFLQQCGAWSAARAVHILCSAFSMQCMFWPPLGWTEILLTTLAMLQELKHNVLYCT